MSHANLTTIEVAVELAIAMIGLAFLLAFVRLVRGPTLPDRVVALDLPITRATTACCATAATTCAPRNGTTGPRYGR